MEHVDLWRTPPHEEVARQDPHFAEISLQFIAANGLIRLEDSGHFDVRSVR